MKMRSRKFAQASVLAASTIAAATISMPSRAAEELEEIVVTGVRQAQQAAIEVKRDAVQIVDSISAEDIGKLPDVTISDSLQRIPGVQIRRDAGEGSTVAVRGLPQVTTLLNGEQYLGANSTTTVQPNFGDIPSQLFSGVDVFKTSTASLINNGITGTVNLRTRRPFDLPQGMTASAALEGSWGSGAEDFDPQGNALIAWSNDRVGALLSVAYSNVNLANYYSGMQGDPGWSGRPGESANWPTDVNGDVNGDGDTTDQIISYQGHTAFNRFTERERAGVNASFQFKINDALSLTADAFYTDQKQFVRTAGMAAEDKWQRWEWFTPLSTVDTGAVIDGSDLIGVDQFLLDTRRLKSFSQVERTDSDSTNINVELKFDNGGKFSGSVRGLWADAQNDQVNSYADIDLANGSQWGIQNSHYPNGTYNPYPNGYAGFPQITVDYRGEHVAFSGVPDIVSDVDAYSIGALSSENNRDRDGKLKVFRVDGKYQATDLISVEGGLRYSERESNQFAYDYLAPLYSPYSSNGSGCLVKWKATDVVLNGGGINGACTAGDAGGAFTALGRLPLSSFGNDVIQITDYGNASGVPPMFTLDPRAMDNPKAFHDALFPGNVRVSNPGGSYGVDVDQTTAFVQANFGGGERAYSLDVGMRFVKTDLTVTQNSVGAPQPYGAANLDAGDLVTDRQFKDYLPSLNLGIDLTDDLKFRIAYSKNMTLLDFEQWGGALTPSYAISDEEGGRFIVIGANSNGNPGLDPWRSTNFDASLEWYANQDTLLSVAFFYVDVESFITRGTVSMALPDQDGVVRRSVNVGTNVQGDGGNLSGGEAGVKHAFTYLPGLLSHFGVDANYTYSPSDSGIEDLSGSTVPFIDNSKTQTNFVLWYEADRFQARIAHNHRSKRSVSLNQIWGTEGLTLYQSPTDYIDASVSFDVTPNVTVYLQGLNLTDEYENYYFQWSNQKAYQQQYERRFIFGVRGRF
ncbi:MAG: TonB-dependent receptor [Povalibacter sp.]|jgi:iron complex outermembrane receptor protein